MNKRGLFSIFVFVFFAISGIAQTTIWLEEFNYPDETTTGEGSPPIAACTADGQEANSSIWVFNTKLQGANTANKNKTFWRIDAGNPIEIDGFTDVSVSIELSSLGTESDDYIDVKYSLDGGTFQDFPNSPFTGVVNTTAVVTGLNGSSLRLEIKMYNTKNQDYYYADNITVVGTNDPSTWLGTVSTDWNNGSNWSTGTVPFFGNNITIPAIPAGGNFPETNSGSIAECYDLLIESGAHLYVPSTAALTINGTLTNNAGAAGLVLKSDASGTGSLLHEDNSVNATVEQYLIGNQWHYVSSPISNATANVFYGIFLKSFDEPSWSWNPYITDPSVSLEVTRGYSAWVDGTNTTVSFEGPLNNGPLSYSVTANSAGPNIGWNLVGNPFASALDWVATSGWTRSNIDGAIYFWQDVGGGDYASNYHYFVGNIGPPIPGIEPVGTEDATQYIPANQAFFIRAAGPSPVLSVDNQARVHNSQAFWKSSQENETPIIRLNATNTSGLNDETIIRFYSEATPEHDSRFDAFKLEGYLVPQLYSITPEATKLAINTLPDFEDGTVIPLGFSAPEAGEYSIDLSTFENFNEEVSVILEDIQNPNLQNLNMDPVYVFTANPDDDAERFLLHFSENLTAVVDVKNATHKIYSYGNQVYVKIGGNNGSATIKVYNMMGQEVFEESINGELLHQFDINQRSGFYLVTAQMGDSYVSQKVFID